MKRFVLLLLLPMALVACGRDIEIDGAWGRVSPGAVSNGAFYMQIANNKGEDDALVAVQSSTCRTIELHESQVDENGVMRMAPVTGGQIALPAGETVTLQPGGLHVMCIGLARPLAMGQRIPLTLVFADAEEIAVEAEIRDEAP